LPRCARIGERGRGARTDFVSARPQAVAAHAPDFVKIDRQLRNL
jgi:hypothetical protein